MEEKMYGFMIYSVANSVLYITLSIIFVKGEKKARRLYELIILIITIR